MKLVVCLVLFFNTFSFGQSFPHISELRGLEDSLNTHLFYRYVYPTTVCWSKSIYHLDVTNGSDTFFIYDAASDPIGEGCRGQYVYDYEFFDNDPAKYIYGGYDYYIDPAPLLVRYDSVIQIPGGGIGGITEVEISHNNDSLVYAALGGGLFKSTDGGYNFTIDLDSLAWIDNSMISLSRNNYSQIYGINDSKLVRSEDEGFNYIIVDNSEWSYDTDLFYDNDESHIYGLSVAYNYSTQSYLSNIYISDDIGNPFTWNTLLEYDSRLWFTLDELISGEIYYSAGNKIFESTDFGANFNLLKELPFKITGMYKKSGTDILYASTPLRIYEITPDSINIIKSLPIPDEVLNYYPLAVGNKWVYDKYTYIEGNTLHDILIREVTSDSLLPNNKQYYRIEEKHYLFPYTVYSFERIDTATGMIYRYYEDPSLPEDEYLIEDLLAEVGDTIWSSREFYDPYFPTLVIEQDIFEKWGLEKPRKVYQHRGLGFYTHSLTNEVGLDSIGYHFDFGETNIVLKGCKINGTVYGDTTVVSVEDETPNLPKEFSLSQNYPNPFNRNEIATLVNEEKPAGEYEIVFNGDGLPSGVYFYQLRAGEFVDTKKLILIK